MRAYHGARGPGRAHSAVHLLAEEAPRAGRPRVTRGSDREHSRVSGGPAAAGRLRGLPVPWRLRGPARDPGSAPGGRSLLPVRAWGPHVNRLGGGRGGRDPEAGKRLYDHRGRALRARIMAERVSIRWLAPRGRPAGTPMA